MQRWAEKRLKTLKSYRKKWPAGLCVMLSGALNAEALNAASWREMEGAEHELVDMGGVAQMMQLKHPKRGGKRWQTKRGRCAYNGCQPRPFEPTRSQPRCGSCNKGRGAYYHQRCYFKVHHTSVMA